MRGRFEGKVVLVTGGASGIGRATALAFATEGGALAIADLNANGAQETVDLIRNQGGQAQAFPADLTRSDDVRSMMHAVLETFGRLDCAVNNAGVGGRGGAWDSSAEDIWDRVIAVNLKGVWLSMQAELAQMSVQGAGVIVNNASIWGLVGNGKNATYTASKHGVVGLTKSAAIEYAPTGIRVNAVCPSFVHTPMTGPLFQAEPARLQAEIARHPRGRLGTAEEVAEAILWLCSESASYINGHALAVDGGFVAQ